MKLFSKTELSNAIAYAKPAIQSQVDIVYDELLSKLDKTAEYTAETTLDDLVISIEIKYWYSDPSYDFDERIIELLSITVNN